MNASTEQYPRRSSNDPSPATTGPVATAPAAAPAAESRTARAGRAVSLKIAAVIGVVTFLLGAGVALLVGGLTGPGGTPPDGAGGPGGAPGTSQSSFTGTGTGTTGA